MVSSTIYRFLFLISFLFSCAYGRSVGMRPEPVLTSFATFPGTFQKVVLDNGFTAYLLEDHSAPVVAIQYWVRFGSADENPELAGVAHVFEHMLFKGTEKYPHGEIGALIEGSGGVVNAWTSYDETVYHTTIASRYWKEGFEVLSDAILHSLFDPEELKKEIEVVQEEIRRGKDDPGREIYERLMALHYKEHPYKRPIIGYPETVSRITRSAMLEVYHNWYVPNNIFLVAVGDFSKEEMISKIQSLFGSIPSRDLPLRPRKREPQKEDPAYLSFSYPADLYRVAVAFPGVSSRDPRTVYLDLLSDLLSSGYNSVLYQNLKKKENLALGIFGFNYTPLDPGLFVVGATATKETLPRLLPELIALLVEMQKVPPPRELLELARSRVKSQFLHNRETYQGIAREIGEGVLNYDDPFYSQTYLQNLEKVQPEDLLEVAREILDLRKVRVVLLSPEGEPFYTEEDLKKWVREGSQKKVDSLFPKVDLPRSQPVTRAGNILFPVSSPAVEDPVRKISVFHSPRGTKLVIGKDEKSSLVSMRVFLLGGQRWEPQGKEGLSTLFARVWDLGTEKKSAEEIQAELDRLGGVLDASADRDTVQITARFPRDKWKEGWNLLLEILFTPSFPEKELSIHREDQIKEIQSIKEQKFRYAFLYFLKEFYGDHPYNHLSIGTEEGVRSVRREDLFQYHRMVVQPENMVVSFVGDVDPEEVFSILKDTLTLDRFPSPLSSPTIPSLLKGKDLKEVVVSVPGHQTHILWGFPGVTVYDEGDRYALSVLDTILSGMGGRLFVELRDQKSLAYAVGSIDAYPLDPGYIVLYIGTAPEKEKIAISEFQRVISEIQAKGVTEEEVERAKRYILGVTEIGLQSTWNRTGVYASGERIFGSYKRYEEDLQGISRVTPSMVQEVTKKYLREAGSVRVILRGERNP